MSCLKLPELPLPTLPDGITITPPALPPIDFQLELCCKIPRVHIPIPPIPLPPVS
jgi:hypothetical protein